jgi:hypothetical protein
MRPPVIVVNRAVAKRKSVITLSHLEGAATMLYGVVFFIILDATLICSPQLDNLFLRPPSIRHSTYLQGIIIRETERASPISTGEPLRRVHDCVAGILAPGK